MFDRQRQRLLAIDVFVRLHGLDGDLGVPVVGGGDDDGVHVGVVEDVAVLHGAAGVRALDDLDRVV